MNKTTIEWTDYNWNPVRGCTKVSQGCKNCYAETMYNRFKGVWGGEFHKVTTHPEMLREPFRIKAPSRFFVNSMSDLFHEDVPVDFIREVYRVMHACGDLGHTFQILTKRPERALAIIPKILDEIMSGMAPRNVWIGVSCEDQKSVDERVPILKQIPAAIRFISCEPLIGGIHALGINFYGLSSEGDIHWVICGGESGPKARPMHPDWVRSLRDQCKAADVPFFFKQWGQWKISNVVPEQHRWVIIFKDGSTSETQFIKNGERGVIMFRSATKTGSFIDGREWLQFPTATMTDAELDRFVKTLKK